MPTDVPTLELTDPVSGLKAIVTPQWGGKVYALRSKEERELIMMTDPHQPIPSSVRNAQVDGGIEWNWSPGLIGHWADTEDHVCELHHKCQLVFEFNVESVEIKENCP